jgi:dihydroxy-acid dehydratase
MLLPFRVNLWGDQIKTAEIFSEEIIKRKENPLHAQGGTVVLKGNIAPNGAVIKQTSASPHLLKHRGKAVVFENRDEMIKRINDPELPVTKDSVLVLKNSGPVGGPGMP